MSTTLLERQHPIQSAQTQPVGMRERQTHTVSGPRRPKQLPPTRTTLLLYPTGSTVDMGLQELLRAIDYFERSTETRSSVKLSVETMSNAWYSRCRLHTQTTNAGDLHLGLGLVAFLSMSTTLLERQHPIQSAQTQPVGMRERQTRTVSGPRKPKQRLLICLHRIQLWSQRKLPPRCLQCIHPKSQRDLPPMNPQLSQRLLPPRIQRSTQAQALH